MNRLKSDFMKLDMAAGSFYCYVCQSKIDAYHACRKGSTKQTWERQRCSGSCVTVRHKKG